MIYRNFTVYSMFAAIWSIATMTAVAQTPVKPGTPLVNEYVADANPDRSEVWWNALGRQLTLMAGMPDDGIVETTLQNIIFFATNHIEKVLKMARQFEVGHFEIHFLILLIEHLDRSPFAQQHPAVGSIEGIAVVESLQPVTGP